MSNILRVRRSSSIRREISKRGVLVSETGLWEYPSGPLTIISAVRVRQQPLTHWSMPTHAASLSPFLVPLTPRRQPHSFRERSSRFVAPPSSLSLSLSLSPPLPLSLIHIHTLSLPLFVSRSPFLACGPLSLSPPLLFIALSPTGPSNPLSNRRLSLSFSLSFPLFLAPLFPTPFRFDPFEVWLACV